MDEAETNIRRELRAPLYALWHHRHEGRTLICPDCQLIANGVMGSAQR